MPPKNRRVAAIVVGYEAAGRIMAERGARHGVADEGGWWPEFSSNSAALDTLMASMRPLRATIVAFEEMRRFSQGTSGRIIGFHD